jgi:hypothetical protein
VQEPVAAVRISSMSDAVRAAVLEARSAEPAAKWIDIDWEPAAMPLAEEAVLRSRADIVKEASQALIAQANQTRESVISLLQSRG